MARKRRGFVVADSPQQWRAITSDVRSMMVQVLITEGEATIPMIAEQLGKKPKSLYRHMEILVDAGLVMEVGKQATSRKSAVLYGIRGKNVRIEFDPEDADHVEEICRLTASEIRHTERESVVALRSGAAVPFGSRKNYILLTSMGWLDAQQTKRVLELANEIESILENSPKRAGTELMAATVSLRPSKRTDVPEE